MGMLIFSLLFLVFTLRVHKMKGSKMPSRVRFNQSLPKQKHSYRRKHIQTQKPKNAGLMSRRHYSPKMHRSFPYDTSDQFSPRNLVPPPLDPILAVIDNGINAIDLEIQNLVSDAQVTMQNANDATTTASKAAINTEVTNANATLNTGLGNIFNANT